MALNFLLKRSGTANKRPNPASMALGELDLNYDAVSGGVFYKDSAGDVVKVGSAQVSATAPNATPAGSAGNSDGEFWYDTSNTTLKIWNGSTWVSISGGGGGSAATPTVLGLTYAKVDGPGVFPDFSCENAIFGYNAGVNLTSGEQNTAVGNSAGLGLTTGNFNTAVGFTTLSVSSAGGEAFNTGVGYQTLSLTGGSGNTSVGYVAGFRAGCGNIGGDNNSFFGNSAGCLLTSGIQNVIIGCGVQATSPTGSCQLAIGFSATANWLTGCSTKAIRPAAGIMDCAASTGTAGQVLMSNGANAICWGTAGGGGGSDATPTAAGIVFGCTISTANGNTALGHQALCAVTTGCFNAVSGSCAGRCITTGCCNTAMGWCALHFVTTGGCNVAIGDSALKGTSTAQTGPIQCNIAIGHAVMNAVTGSYNNVIIGNNAAFTMVNAFNNVGVGGCALFNLTTGSGNVAIGNCSGTDALCSITVENNRVILGNNLTQVVYSKVAPTNASDVRWKKVAGEVPLALPFVNSINTIKYQFCDPETGDLTDDRYRYGFSAQDILAHEENPDHPVLVSTENEAMYGLAETQFIPVLVNAIKELSAKNDELEARLRALEIPG